MNYIEIERDTTAPWGWARRQHRKPMPAVAYVPPTPMPWEDRKRALNGMARQERAFYRMRPITELAARAILSTTKRRAK